MAEFDRIVEALYNKIFYNEGNIDDILTQDGIETFKKLLRIGSINIIEAGTDPETGVWYRLYSDGWCEQGGITTPSSSATKTITLAKEYANTNYSILLGASYTTTATYTPNTNYDTKTTKGFTLYDSTNTSVRTYWQTSGYINTEN